MEKTNAQLAEELKWLAGHLDGLGWTGDCNSPDELRLAAQRLESLSQVTEAEVEAAARVIFDLDECEHDCEVIARAALEAARKART